VFSSYQILPVVSVFLRLATEEESVKKVLTFKVIGNCNLSFLDVLTTVSIQVLGDERLFNSNRTTGDKRHK
jgi:hypothetical protein